MSLSRVPSRWGGSPDQLAWLLEAIARPSINIHVIPAKTAAYTGLSGGFTLLEHAEGGPVAYVEVPASTGRMLRDVDNVTELVRCFDFIRSAALPLVDTANLINGIMEEL